MQTVQAEKVPITQTNREKYKIHFATANCFVVHLLVHLQTLGKLLECLNWFVYLRSINIQLI
jgi:hypothetical protein